MVVADVVGCVVMGGGGAEAAVVTVDVVATGVVITVSTGVGLAKTSSLVAFAVASSSQIHVESFDIEPADNC